MEMDELGFDLGGKLPDFSLHRNLLCLYCRHPLLKPLQTSCGCRICKECFERLCNGECLALGSGKYECKKCKDEFSLNPDEVFQDRAAQLDLRIAIFPCYYKHCQQSVSNDQYRAHVYSCPLATLRCPNEGCNLEVFKATWEEHLNNCPAQPKTCDLCKKSVPSNIMENHVLEDCPECEVSCPWCSTKKLRKELVQHKTKCQKEIRSCKFQKFGCSFKGTYFQLQVHYNKDHSKLDFIDKGIKQLLNFQSNTSSDSQELALLVQTLQATSYNGQFLWKIPDLTRRREEASAPFYTSRFGYNGQLIWKIPDLTRRREEAKSGKTLSLYSAPFYTSRFGYKLCLRLYLNGDGSGKGTHLSFFLTIMKGDHDSLLPWPFSQKVKLMLLDQDNTQEKKHVIQCFKPDPSSSSFWKPKTEMNVASGCPKFAPLSVLSNPTYIKDDTLFLKCVVDTTGLTRP